MTTAEPMPGNVAAALRHVERTLGYEVGIELARPLRVHDATTIQLPRRDLVARLVRVNGDAYERAARATELTAWLAAHSFPTVRPTAATPVRTAEYVVTLWHYEPPVPRSPTLVRCRALGEIVRSLHALPEPPSALPPAAPLARLRAAVALDRERTQPVLTLDEAAYLDRRCGELEHWYATTEFPLGMGLIHNDAHTGNILESRSSSYGHLLTDWESACIGPREMDVVLVGAPGSRFGDTEDERQAFVEGYGYDIARWPGHVLLREIRDLHSLAGHIRVAPSKPAALGELSKRISSLMRDDRQVRWSAV